MIPTISTYNDSESYPLIEERYGDTPSEILGYWWYEQIDGYGEKTDRVNDEGKNFYSLSGHDLCMNDIIKAQELARNGRRTQNINLPLRIAIQMSVKRNMIFVNKILKPEDLDKNE